MLKLLKKRHLQRSQNIPSASQFSLSPSVQNKYLLQNSLSFRILMLLFLHRRKLVLIIEYVQKFLILLYFFLYFLTNPENLTSWKTLFAWPAIKHVPRTTLSASKPLHLIPLNFNFNLRYILTIPTYLKFYSNPHAYYIKNSFSLSR